MPGSMSAAPIFRGICDVPVKATRCHLHGLWPDAGTWASPQARGPRVSSGSDPRQMLAPRRIGGSNSGGHISTSYSTTTATPEWQTLADSIAYVTGGLAQMCHHRPGRTCRTTFLRRQSGL